MNTSLWASVFKLTKWRTQFINLLTLSLLSFLLVQSPAALYKIFKYSNSIHTPITFLNLTFIYFWLLVIKHLVLGMHLLYWIIFIFNCLISKICEFDFVLLFLRWYLQLNNFLSHCHLTFLDIFLLIIKSWLRISNFLTDCNLSLAYCFIYCNLYFILFLFWKLLQLLFL